MHARDKSVVIILQCGALVRLFRIFRKSGEMEMVWMFAPARSFAVVEAAKGMKQKYSETNEL